MEMKVSVYKDKEKTISHFEGTCVAISNSYCYCVPKDSNELIKVYYDRVDIRREAEED